MTNRFMKFRLGFVGLCCLLLSSAMADMPAEARIRKAFVPDVLLKAVAPGPEGEEWKQVMQALHDVSRADSDHSLTNSAVVRKYIVESFVATPFIVRRKGGCSTWKLLAVMNTVVKTLRSPLDTRSQNAIVGMIKMLANEDAPDRDGYIRAAMELDAREKVEKGLPEMQKYRPNYYRAKTEVDSIEAYNKMMTSQRIALAAWLLRLTNSKSFDGLNKSVREELEKTMGKVDMKKAEENLVSYFQ